ncbi:hypothetical protein GF389_04255 [Candidatus Dojkabacteria bacterium]|nr:hypothetical protein [Candidatus Dojkabacteria bacterium]
MKEVKSIYNIENLSEELYEHAGGKAIEYKSIFEAGLVLPPTIILTSGVFDKFLLENDLVDSILEQLSQVETNQKSASKVAKRVKKLIVESQVPNSTKQELKMHYKKLAGLGQAPLRIFPSPLEPELEASMNVKGIESSFSFGFEDFLNDIKENWAEMFSEQALLYRESIQYEGSLSMGMVILKSPIAEVSTLVTTKNPLLQKNQIELNTILGTVEPLLRGELIGDRYVCNAETGDILEKSVVEQKWMAVYKLTKKKYLEHKLKISNVWRSKQKLSDKNIKSVVDYTSKLTNVVDYPFEAVFQLEMGKMILVEVSRIELITAVAEPGSNLEALKKKIENEVQETEAVVGEERTIESHLGESEIEEPEDDLSNVDEQKEAGNLEEIVDSDEQELPEIDLEEIDPEKEIKTIIDVVGTNWNLPEYVRFHKNLDLLINLSGQDYLAQNEKTELTSFMKYLENVLTHSHEDVVYELSAASDEFLKLQLEGIRKLRNNKQLKNLWVAISGIRNEDEYLNTKKQISLAKLRRSSTFKVLAMIDNAASAMMVEDIIESSCDGLIYNLDRIVENTLGEYKAGETPVGGVKKILKVSLKTASDHKADTYVIGEALDKDFGIQEIVKMGATGIGTKLADTLKTKERVKKASKI